MATEHIEIKPERLKHEYEFGIGYLYRWEMYKFAESGLLFHDESINSMQLSGCEDMLDIGCGQGEFLKTIEARGHSGHLVGIDSNSSLEFTRHNTNVELLDGDVSECLAPDYDGPTAFPDNTFDVASALFMLYHVASPEATLRDLSRIVKPGGKIVIATSAPDNKQRHRAFEQDLAKDMGVEKPASYTKTFTTREADELLPTLFGNIECAIEQQDSFIIRAEDIPEDLTNLQLIMAQLDSKLGVYMLSFRSMIEQYGSTEEETYKAIANFHASFKRVVLSGILKDIEETGEFVETIHRSLYICTNDK